MDDIELFEKNKEKFIKAFSLLSLEDKQKTLKNEYEIVISVKKIKKRNDSVSLENTIDYNFLLRELLASTSKIEAERKISEVLITKKDILSFAKFIKVQAQTKDSIPVLKSRIIESTVGAKLRSDAIRGVTSL